MSLSSEPMRSLRALCRSEGAFLESVLPVRAFATLTTLQRFSEARICGAFGDWILGLQAHGRLTLGWVRAIETHPRRHIHVALVAAAALDCDHAAIFWRQLVAPRYADAAKVKPFRPGLCGLGYILKTLAAPYEDVRLSENLNAFAVNCPSIHCRTNFAQRRQYRRVQAQIQANGGSARRGRSGPE